MTRQTRIVRPLSALAILATLIASSKPTLAEAADDASLTASLRAIADAFGDELGHIVSVDGSNETVVLAIDLGRSYAIYTAGDQVQASDTFVLCHEDEAGGLSTCAPLPPGSDEYDCGYDETDSWCICYGVTDCFFLAMEMCREPLECDPDLICSCAV